MHSGAPDADDLVREAAQGNASTVRQILQKYPGEVAVLCCETLLCV